MAPPIPYTAKNEQWRGLIAEKVTRQHFMHHNGFRLGAMAPGYVEVHAPLALHLQQQDGKVHGGVTATMADLAMGFAAFSLVGPDDRVVTSDLKVSYFRPGTGEALYARGWVLKPGSRLCYCEAEIFVLSAGQPDVMMAKGYAIMAVLGGRNAAG